MTFIACVAALFLTAVPVPAEPHLVLGDDLPPLALSLGGDPSAREARRISLLGDEHGGGEQEHKEKPKDAAKEPGSLDFDLLGAAAEGRRVDEHALRLRRKLLTWHQGVGLGMFTLQLATTVVGQLNYDDKFGSANTGKYVQPHALLAGATLAAFAAAGALALLAPAPLPRDEGFDRVKLHKLSMLTATVGMAAQAALGIWTQSREGYLNQQGIGTAHLVIGYVTLAAVAAGVGALVL